MSIRSVAACILFVLVLAGCSLLGGEEEPEVKYFTVRVDSVTVPSSAAPTDTLDIGLHGTIGPNGCYGLERIEAERAPGAVELEVIGRFVRADACPAVIVPLDTTYSASPPLEGPFEITVLQPDGSRLERTVAVQE